MNTVFTVLFIVNGLVTGYQPVKDITMFESDHCRKVLTSELKDIWGEDFHIAMKAGYIIPTFENYTDLKGSKIYNLKSITRVEKPTEEMEIYDKNVSVSNLTGTNKEYIDKHISHLSNLISDDIEQVIKGSELVIITHKIKEIAKMIPQYNNKIFIDFTKVTNKKFDNYEGLCW